MKVIKKTIYLVLAIALILPALVLQTGHASASTTQTLNFNTTVTNTISNKNAEQVYKITLPSAGTVKVNLNSYIEAVILDLTDENGKSVWGYSRDIYDGSASTPKQWSDQADLEAGIYYIKISQSSDYTGKYDLKVGFNTAGNNETEPNNGTSQAQPITLNTQKINGFLSLNDDTDCYKFILKQAGTIDVHVDSNIYDASLDLLDESGNDVWGIDEDIYGGSSQTPKQWSKSVDLEAGTYYIKISNSSGYTGKYNLYVNYTPAGNNEVEPNNGTSQAQELSNGQKVTGFLSWSDDTDVYKVNLPKAGNLKISLDSSIDWAYVDLIDANGNNIWDEESVYDGTKETPKQWMKDADLEAGTYYIKIHSPETGTYHLSTWFTAAGNNESEPNNGTTQAQQISLNTQKITGFLSESDHTDCYKFTLPKAVKVTMNVDSSMKGVDLHLTNSKGTALWDDYIYDGSIETPKQWNKSESLPAGTYYLKISSDYNTGKYVLSVNAPLYPSAPSINTVSTNSTSVSGKTDANCTVYVKAGSKTYKGKSNNKGDYKVSIPKQKAGTKIYVYATNTYGKSGTKVTTVGSPATTPSVNTVSNKSTSISGKTSKSSTVYVKIGSKTCKGKSNSKGDYKVSIPKQKAGTKIYVYATNTYGKSGTKSVTVVDRIAPSTPSVYTVSHTSRYITGKTEAYATVTAYTGSKKIGSAEADKHSSYKIKISPKKKGTAIKVKATDKSGNSSGYRTVKVK
ncbi:Ig-like domain-containing protein [Heyndrickxia coagulans]|uniref:Peptidase domain protein n=1 Tax=Heyndrickxia coagulans 36D1 TaxID=345219 RepID=G2THB8_HEYCO|nr:Ig-like domain-containing protein [Heyndrickxia coagulans]AEP00018.1 peptidase domain protein [Heyndrickxia coagulans 36D1]